MGSIPTRALSVLLLASVSLLAQADGWTLLRGIYPGQTTHVHLQDGRLQKGGFIATTDTGIVIRQRTGDKTFAKDQIRKVSVRKASKRWRNAAIGAAAGTGAILILLAAHTSADGGGAPYASGAVGAAMWGGGIGALFPGYDTLYRAPKK